MMACFKLVALFCLLLMISSQKTCQDYCQPNGCNCYKVLKIGRKADFNEIKKTYRTLAQQYHPDVNPGKDTSAKFAEIAHCYEIFKDKRSRAEYHQCMDYGYDSYSTGYHPDGPRNNNESLWGLMIPLISFFMNRIRDQRNPQAQQNPQPTGQKVKKVLKWIGFLVVFGIAGALFMFSAPDFMTEPVLEGVEYVYDLFGGNIIYMLLFGYWTYSMIKWVILKVSSLFVKPSKEDEIKKFFSDLRNTIDLFHDKILQKAKRNKENKEDEIIMAKDQELEVLERSHSEKLSFVQQPENEEKKDLLKAEKEEELLKMHNKNIELCESQSEEKLKQANEDFNNFIDSHNKTCEYYRRLASNAEKDIETKLKENKVTYETVKEELQKLANDIAAKMSTVWQVGDSEDQQKS